MVVRVTCMKIKQRLANLRRSEYNFCSGSISKYFIKDEQSEVSLNGTVYDFSVDHSSVKREGTLGWVYSKNIYLIIN